jgi:DNA polymerase III alpha subunit
MLYEFDSWKHLTAKEQEAIANAYNSGSQKPKDLTQAIEWLITNTKINSRRLQSVEDIKNSLKNPFYDIDDKPETIAADEEKYMSCSLTCSKVDGLDLNTVINMCQDVSSHSIIGKVTLAVEIVRIKIVKTKKGKTPGQEMAFLTVEDGSGSLDSITIFPEAYDKYKDLLVENNTVLLIGEIFKKDKEAIIVNQVSQI